VTDVEPVERRPWDDVDPGRPHVWLTLGYRRVEDEPGRMVIEWDATEDYAFPAENGYIVHGGLVTTILDSAMGGACWTLLERDETFLTAELRTEFHRAARPGLLRAEARVVQRTKRLMFCAGELYDDAGNHLASSRCTQVLRTVR
jgi:uncharacterized protein (TIGR00369 family)